MQKEVDVLTLGDICVDLILNGKDIMPEFGQKEKIFEDYRLEMGGSCTIFACQTAKLGLKTVVLGRTGEDVFGELIVKNLKESGVNTDYIIKDSQYKTGMTIAFNKHDDRGMLTYCGTIDAIENEDISDELLKSVRHFHIGSYFLMKKIQPYYPGILKKLKEYGATISLDTNWDPEEKWNSGIWNIIPYIDIFLPNENEAMAITDESSLEKAIQRLREYIPHIVVKKGKKGAVVYSKDEIYEIPSIDVKKVDAVGAGDTFDGGFVYGFLSGKSIEECAKIGCICGSLNTRAHGGIKGQPRLEEVLKYLAY